METMEEEIREFMEYVQASLAHNPGTFLPGKKMHLFVTLPPSIVRFNR